mgnify:FL=1
MDKKKTSTLKHSVFDAYLNKFSVRETIIDKPVSSELGLIVVIPCYNEASVVDALFSLNSAEKPACSVEVIVVVNQGDDAGSVVTKRNLDSIAELDVVSSNLWFDLHVVEELNLPMKYAGVGLARKIGLDEGIRRFSMIRSDGILVCFDADSLVAKNYFVELEEVFKKDTLGCNIYFEHDIVGSNSAINKAIIDYELFLRYYNLAMNYIGVPYAHFTVGSSMAFTCAAYMRVGGMNKRKAGEDFYFLHKIIQLGHFQEVTSTTVFPSARCSDRVPFGTGKAVSAYIENKCEQLQTYPLSSFLFLKCFTEKLRNYDLKKWPKEIVDFLPPDFMDSLKKVRLNAKSTENYIFSAFQLFNAFQALKFLHFMREKDEAININDAVLEIMTKVGHNVPNHNTNAALLKELRKMDKELLYRCH